jgi:predicted unusual protein kinase regulating ubiquinone biosynthesis (AarF/ABC1/UbiB family)
MSETIIPKGKIKRTFSSGRIAAKMGTNQLGFMIKRPFLSEKAQQNARQKKDSRNAAILFNGLSLLRGTALKAAQFLSMESDLFPETIRRELEKSYNQVPPINRALVRKIIQNRFGKGPEDIFKSFDTKAFAAASLGQVHRAVTSKGQRLAIKIQYPDIADTISSDIKMMKTAIRPLGQYELLRAGLNEIEKVLLEEIDYIKEASNIEFFSKNLSLDNVHIPKIHKGYTFKNILAMSMIDGEILNYWLDRKPDPEQINTVAQTLHDIFIKGFYELGVIHADPNPGNFIISKDLEIGLVDFGCVKAFDEKFISLYKRLVRVGGSREKDDYKALLRDMAIISPRTPKEVEDQLILLFMDMGNWFYKLYEKDTFDFGKNPDFFEKGKEIGQTMHKFRKYIVDFNPNFIFLDRTRYGLMRIFEKMKAKIKIRNKHECP